MNHAKILVIDSSTAVVGSQNLDFLSMELNAEAGLIITEEKSVKRLINIVQKWQGESKVFDRDNYKLSLFDNIIAHILHFFIIFI